MRGLALIALLSVMADPAIAGQAVTLRADVTDADGIVTLSDLFEVTGPAGKTVLATRAGASIVLDAGPVQASARRSGLDWANREGLRRIIVVSGSDGSNTSISTRANVEVLTYARSLSAGESVGPADLVWAKVAAEPADAPHDAEAIMGLVARRPLRAGSVVSLRDVTAPMVIKAGDLVTLTYENDGITLSLQAKAMAAAALGDAVMVENPTSRKVVQAVASGPGTAVVGPAADQFRRRTSTQLAQR